MKLDVREANLTEEQHQSLIQQRSCLLFVAVYACALVVMLIPFFVCAFVFNLKAIALAGFVLDIAFAPLLLAAAVAAVYYAKASW